MRFILLLFVFCTFYVACHKEMIKETQPTPTRLNTQAFQIYVDNDSIYLYADDGRSLGAIHVDQAPALAAIIWKECE